MSNDIVLQITQPIQRIQQHRLQYPLQPLPLSDDEQSDCEAPFTVRSRAKTSDEEINSAAWTEQDLQAQEHTLKACCVRNTPIVSNWIYQNISALSIYLLKAAIAQLRKITA